MKIKTSELEGVALDWAVAKAIGLPLIGAKLNTFDENHLALPARYSIGWSHGGPLIERYGVELFQVTKDRWAATATESDAEFDAKPLIAACRAIVAAKLGDEVDVPDELRKEETE